MKYDSYGWNKIWMELNIVYIGFIRLQFKHMHASINNLSILIYISESNSLTVFNEFDSEISAIMKFSMIQQPRQDIQL